MNKFLVAFALLSSDAFAARQRKVAENIFEQAKLGECPASVGAPAGGESLQEHFDEQRVQLNLLGADEFAEDMGDVDLSTHSTDTCTKRDVCLLMRQLDMDFTQRARSGTLTDMDFDVPPEVVWVLSGNCVSAEQKRGKRFLPVTDEDKCRAKLAAAGVQRPADVNIEAVSLSSIPSGCVIVHNMISNKKKVYINSNINSPASAGHVVEKHASRADLHGKDTNTQQLCEHDRSLSETASVYYSPYKLKPSMVANPERSTSCSFGMMAYLAKLRETRSSCAKILTIKTFRGFHSVAAAVQAAAAAEAQGNTEEAAELRAYTEDVRQKYVLIDTIANQWCPGVWNFALRNSEGTCDVRRKPSWMKKVGGGAAATPGRSLAARAGGRAGAVKKTGMKKKGPGGRMGQVKGGEAKGANADRLKRIATIMEEHSDEVSENLAGDATEDDDSAPAATGPVAVRLQKDMDGKWVKLALSDSVCSMVPDETLASILAGKADASAPPDFFRDANIEDGDKHPSLTSASVSRFVHE